MYGDCACSGGGSSSLGLWDRVARPRGGQRSEISWLQAGAPANSSLMLGGLFPFDERPSNGTSPKLTNRIENGVTARPGWTPPAEWSVVAFAAAKIFRPNYPPSSIPRGAGPVWWTLPGPVGGMDSVPAESVRGSSSVASQWTIRWHCAIPWRGTRNSG